VWVDQFVCCGVAGQSKMSAAAKRAAARRERILARGKDRMKFVMGEQKELDKAESPAKQVTRAARPVQQPQTKPKESQASDDGSSTKKLPTPSSRKTKKATETDKVWSLGTNFKCFCVCISSQCSFCATMRFEKLGS
jgi:hypothetical protein